MVAVYPVDISARANLDDDGLEQPLAANYFNIFNVNIQNTEVSETLRIEQLDMRITVNADDVYTQSVELNQDVLPAAILSHEEIVAVGNTIDDHVLHITFTDLDVAGNQVHYQHSVLFDDVRLSVDMASVSLDDVPLSGGFATATLCINNKIALTYAA